MKTKTIAGHTKPSSLQRRTIYHLSIALLLVAGSFAQSPDGERRYDKSGQSTSASTQVAAAPVQESPSKGKQCSLCHVLRMKIRAITLRSHGGFARRTAYAFTRLFVTRSDSGGEAFNFSEIVGNGAGAGISDLYYPSQERTWTKTGQKWASQVALDGIFNVMKEFWPDIRQHVIHKIAGASQVNSEAEICHGTR